MSQRTRKPTRARVAAALTASVLAPALSLGLFAPSASAATMAGHRAAGPFAPCDQGPLGENSKGEVEYGTRCNGLVELSSLLNPVMSAAIKPLCLNKETNTVVCRVAEDEAPDNNYGPGGGPRT
jgi:hypothetical protein